MISIQLRIIFSRRVKNEDVRNIEVFLIIPCQNSDANSALIHHRDIVLLREVRRTAMGSANCPILHPGSRQHGPVYPTNREAATDHSG